MKIPRLICLMTFGMSLSVIAGQADAGQFEALQALEGSEPGTVSPALRGAATVIPN